MTGVFWSHQTRPKSEKDHSGSEGKIGRKEKKRLTKEKMDIAIGLQIDLKMAAGRLSS